MDTTELNNNRKSHFIPFSTYLSKIPAWLLIVCLLGITALWKITGNQDFYIIFSAVSKGIFTTLYVSVISYFLSIIFGLIFGLMRVSQVRFLREISTFYIEIVRGIPMLVILYYIAFVGAPSLVSALNWVLSPLIDAGVTDKFTVRDISFVVRAIIALTIGYSAFIAEIFRAGIESVDRGQMEAALSSGMSRRQAMQYVILPQAVRNVLPPLGNEFVAMVKDSALVSALGVQDITQLGKVYSSSTFRFFETYNIVAFLYLTMTISLSLVVRKFERYLEKFKR